LLTITAISNIGKLSCEGSKCLFNSKILFNIVEILTQSPSEGKTLEMKQCNYLSDGRGKYYN